MGLGLHNGGGEMLSDRTLKQAKEFVKRVEKINKLGGEAKFRNNPNTVVLIICPICKQRQSEFRIKVPTGGCENHCKF